MATTKAQVDALISAATITDTQLSGTNWTDLTDGGSSTLHTHAGNTLTAPTVIATYSRNSLGAGLAALASAAPTSTAYPAANRAIYIPFELDEAVTVTKIAWMNGATVSGNVDAGIYNASGTRLVSAGSTAQATSNVLQEVDIADTALAVGRYYLAIACDNTTSTFFAFTAAQPSLFRALGMAQQATAFVLPAPATFAVVGSSFAPVVAVSVRTLLA